MCQLIPVYEQGFQFQPSAIEMADGQTSPPQLLSEADLISLMEKHGIGTVQTHTQGHCVFNVYAPIVLQYQYCDIVNVAK